MDKLKVLEVFVAVVENKSFSIAANLLDISNVMVGRYIQQLEEYAKVSLIERTTRKLKVTEAGWNLYNDAIEILKKTHLTFERMEEYQEKPNGVLRVSAPMTFGSAILAPLVAQFMSEQPDIKVELILNNQLVDLFDDQFDCSIRIGNVQDDFGLIARKIMNYEMAICAAPAYLARYGEPQNPTELMHHRLLIHSSWKQNYSWPLIYRGEPFVWPLNHWVMNSNDGEVLRQSALFGNGIIMQPKFLLEEDLRQGRLISILKEYIPESKPIHLLYTHSRFKSLKLQSFINFLIPLLKVN